MDPDFLRELLVLAVVSGLDVVGSAALLRGHKADLSLVAATGTRRALARTDGGEARLNRRRKARLREAQARGETADGDSETSED